MIIGNGTIGSVLIDREDRIYFASGVSNSQEKKEAEFQREIELLLAQDFSRHLVYFSSLSIFSTDSKYTRHKLRMESLVRKHFERYTIMRLGNPTWGSKPWHLVPYFREKIKANEPFEIKDVWRYALELDEFLYWVGVIPEWSCEMNVTGNRMKVKDLIEKYCKEVV